MPVPRFNLIYQDGTNEEVRMRPRAQIQYEADTGEPLFKDSDNIHMTTIYKMAWYAAGKPDTLEIWADRLEDAEMIAAPDGEGEAATDEANPPTAEALPD